MRAQAEAECFRQLSNITSISDIHRLYTGEGIAECSAQKEQNVRTLTETEQVLARSLGITPASAVKAKQLAEVRREHNRADEARNLAESNSSDAAAVAGQLARQLGISSKDLADYKADTRTLAEKVSATFRTS